MSAASAAATAATGNAGMYQCKGMQGHIPPRVCACVQACIRALGHSCIGAFTTVKMSLYRALGEQGLNPRPGHRDDLVPMLELGADGFDRLPHADADADGTNDP